jgi:hypothetical protein
MLTVKVLGSGCENCKKVEETARKVLTMMGMQAKLVKVTDWAESRIPHPGYARTGDQRKGGVRRAHPNGG